MKNTHIYLPKEQVCKCAKFHPNPRIFGLSGLPQMFWPNLGLKWSPRPQNKYFQKIKKAPPGIYSRNKCAKIQPNPTIFGLSRLPQSFSLVLAKNSSAGLKNQNFEKMKKTPPDIHLRNKCAKFQPNPTIFEVYRLPQSFGTYRQTHRQTDIVRL